MKVELQDISSCRKKVDVEVGTDKVKEVYDDIFKLYTKNAAIKGFRKGKVPASLIKSKFKDSIINDVGGKILEELAPKVLKDKEITPVYSPMADQLDFNMDDMTCKFTLLVDIKPEFDVKDYKGKKIKVEKKVYPVGEEQINDALLSMQERFATYEPVEGREAKEDDWCIVNYTIKVENKNFAERKDAWLLVKEKQPGLFDTKKLIGMNKGDKKEIECSFPDDFSNKEYAGKKGIADVELKDIKIKQMPELDDEFAKDLGIVDNISALKDKVKQELTVQAETKTASELEDDVMQKILDNNKFDVPETLVSMQQKHLFENAVNSLKQQGLPDDYIKNEAEKIKENFKKRAEGLVRMQFIIDKVAEIEKIKVKKEDVDVEIEKMAVQYNKDKDELKQELLKKGTIDNLYSRLKDRKVAEFLTAEADISEKIISKNEK